jgi:hypothetical protein
MPESSSSYSSKSRYPAWYFDDDYTSGSSGTKIPTVDLPVRLSDLPGLSDLSELSHTDSHRPTLAVETGYTKAPSSSFSSSSYHPTFSFGNYPYASPHADPWSPISPRAPSQTSPSASKSYDAVTRAALLQSQDREFKYGQNPATDDKNRGLSSLSSLIEYSTPDIDDNDDDEGWDYPPRGYGPIAPPPRRSEEPVGRSTIQEVVIDLLSSRYVVR